MMWVLLAGAGLGIGLWALAVGLAPPRPPLGPALARLTTPPKPPGPLPASGGSGWVVRLGRPFTSVLAVVGLPTAARRRDLTVLARPVRDQLARQATGLLAGLLLPTGAVLVLALAGLPTGITLPVLAALSGAAAGFLTPDLAARRAAARRRAEFRHALSAFLDLISITLAGGAGVDSALREASAAGQGWAFTQLRHALDAARLTRATPAAALRRLGDDLDIGALSELAASLALAGTEGASVRASLHTKAATLRTHQLTQAEADAQAATERLSLPLMLLFLGFLIFIGYPALTQVLTGL